MGLRRPLAAACLALGGCSFQADNGAARYRCGEGERCPDGTTCVDGWCERFDAGQEPLPTCAASDAARISFEDGRSAQTDLAWDGQELGVVWAQAGLGQQIRFIVAGEDGPGGREPVTLSNPAAPASWPTIGWTGALFGAFFATTPGGTTAQLAYRAVDPSGNTPSDAPLTLSSSESGAVPMRSQERAKGQHGVAWQDSLDGNDEVYFNLYSDGGIGVGEPILVTENVGASWFPSLAWTGTEWGVAWNDDRDGNIEIYFTRLDSRGERIEGDRRISNAPGPSFAPSLIWTGDAYLVSWWDGRAEPSEMFAARLVPGAATEIGPEIRLRPGEYGQVGSFASAGERIGLVWHAWLGELLVPVFALVDPASGELVTAPLPLSDGGVSIDPESLAITGTGDGFAVAWGDDRSGDVEIYATRVTCE